jgi:hypothetical protein
MQCHGSAGANRWWKLAVYWAFPPMLERPARRFLSWWRQHRLRRGEDRSEGGAGSSDPMDSPGKGTQA